MEDNYKVYCIDYTAKHRITLKERLGRVFVPGRNKDDSLKFFRERKAESLENSLGAGFDIDSYISTEVRIEGFEITAKVTN